MVWLLLKVVVEISCWQKRYRVELHGTRFPVWWLILVFISFSLLWMVLVPLICFRLVPFLKAIIESVIKVSLQLWFAYKMCQCFVTDRGVHCLSWRFCWSSSCLRSSWSTFWIFLCDNIFFVSFINKLLDKYSRVTVVFLECWAYSPNLKCLAVGNTVL